MRRAFCAFKSFAQQSDYFAILTTALAGIFVKNHVIECRTEYACQFAQILIASITRTTNHYGTTHAFCSGHGIKGRNQCAHSVGIVSIVCNHGRVTVRHLVEACWRALDVVVEALEASDDLQPGQAKRPASTDGG